MTTPSLTATSTVSTIFSVTQYDHTVYVESFCFPINAGIIVAFLLGCQSTENLTLPVAAHPPVHDYPGR